MTYDLIVDDLDNYGFEVSGKLDTLKQKLFINTKNTKEDQYSTVIHEFIEAVDSFNEMNLSHKDITILEIGLYQMLSDNGFLNKKRI